MQDLNWTSLMNMVMMQEMQKGEYECNIQGKRQDF